MLNSLEIVSSVGVASVTATTELDTQSITLTLDKVASDSSGDTYQKSWTVQDTHDTKYHTVFTATNTAGQSDTTTLAWSDACTLFTDTGNYNLSSQGSCTLSVTDGANYGGLTIPSGTTLTMAAGATLVFNGGASGSLTIGGTIATVHSSGATIQKGYLYYKDGVAATAKYYIAAPAAATGTCPGGGTCDLICTGASCPGGVTTYYKYYTDADNDGYAPNATLTVSSSSTAPAGYKASVSGTNDCDDSNATKYPGNLNWYTDNADHDCDGVVNLDNTTGGQADTCTFNSCDGNCVTGYAGNPTCGTSATRYDSCAGFGASCTVATNCYTKTSSVTVRCR